MASSSSRVVFLTGNYPPTACGIGDYVANLVPALQALGHPIQVWTRRQAGVKESNLVKTPATTFDKEGMQDVLQRLRDERPGLLHVQYEADTFDGNRDFWPLVMTANSLGISLVTTFHALDGPRAMGKMHRMAILPLLLGSRDIVVCSKKQYDGIRKLPLVGPKVQMITAGNTIPVTGKRKPRTGDEPVHLVYFGFVWTGRNVETCIRAFAAVNETQNARLTIAGGIRDTAYRKELGNIAAALGVTDKVTFTGEVSPAEVSQILADADIALLPFATGVSTGRSTLWAALEHRVPVVTMGDNDNLIPEFRNNDNMLYVPTTDPDGFILETVRLAADKELRDRLVAHIPALVATSSWKEIARRNNELPSYKKLNAV